VAKEQNPENTSTTEAGHDAAKTTPRKAEVKLENFAVESEGRRNNPGAHHPDGYIER
jgi:hypothetical protein